MKTKNKIAVFISALLVATAVNAAPAGLGLRRDLNPGDSVFIIDFNRNLMSNQVVSQSSSTLRLSVESPGAGNSPVNLAYQHVNMVSALAANPASLENPSIFKFYLHDREDWDGSRRDRQRIELAGARNSRIMAYDTTNRTTWNFDRDYPVDTRTIFTYRWKIRIPDDEGTGWPAHFDGTSHMGFNHLFQIKAVMVSSISGNEAAGPMFTWSVTNGNRFRFIYTRLSCGGGSQNRIDVPMSRIRNRWLYKEVTIHYSDSGYVHTTLWDIDDPANPVRLGEAFFAADTWRRPETSPCSETQLASTVNQQIRPKWGLYRSFNGRQGEARMDFADATIIKRNFNNYVFPNGYNPRTRRIEEIPDPDPEVAVANVTLNKNTMTIMAGSREALTATVAPPNATNSTVTWTTSNAQVATVSGGVVTAVSAGTATITATAGGRTATLTVTVVPATSLDAIRHIYVSNTNVRNATVRGSSGITNSNDGGVYYVQHNPSNVGTWFSIDAEIPRRGNYKIEFIYKGGTTRATVQPYIGLNPDLLFDVATNPANRIGDPISMVAPTSPAAANVANVSTLIGATGANRDALYYHRVLAESRELMRGNNTFTTVVTALPTDDERWTHLPVQLILTPIAGPVYCDVCDHLEDECTCGDIAVESVILNKSALTIMEGARETMTSTVLPSNATNRAVTWESSNTAVATVTNGGVVTAVAPGTTTITVTSADGNIDATSTINVVSATSVDAIRVAYASSATVRNSTVQGGGVDGEGNPEEVNIVNSSDGGVFYVQTMSSDGTWFSIDVDVPTRGLYKIDFVYKTGARATVQPYIGPNFALLEPLGEPIDMRSSPTAVNVSTLLPGATGTRDAHYYMVTLAESKELGSGSNTFRTVVVENGGNWAHLPVQLVVTLLEPIAEDVCDVCDMKINECICDIGDDDDTSIRRRQPTDGKRGILLENAIVSDFARFEVKTPNASLVNIRITDNLGNALFEASGRSSETFVWDLTNNAGRLVASGSYLLIAETIDLVTGQIYVYHARIGVKR
jgi:uncharacterized protein YjdB